MQATPVYISLARGLAQSTDPDMVAVNQGTLRLENCLIQQKESLIKRPGTTAIGNLDTSGNPVPVFARLLNRGDSLIGLGPYGSPAALYSYSLGLDRWAPALPSISSGPSTISGPTAYSLKTVAGGVFASQASANIPGYNAIGFVNADGEGEARIVDEQTGVTLFMHVFTATGGEVAHARVLACNSLFVWLADDMNNQRIVGYVVDPANPVGFAGNVTTHDVHPWQSCLDAIVIGNTIHAAYALQGGGVEGATITPTAGSLPTTNYGMFTAGSTAISPSECMSFVRDLGGSGKIGLVSVDLSNGVMVHWNIPVAGGSAAISVFVESVQSRAHHTLNVTACTTTNAAGGDVQVIAEFHPSDLFLATCAGNLGGAGWTSAGLGVGKTLTATATGVQTVDSHALALSDVVLVTGDLSGAHTLTAKDWGLYRVSTAGAVGVACVLTRATNFDTAAEITRDALVRVTAGGFANAEYHIAKVLDGESAVGTFAPGTFTLDESALEITFFDPAATPRSQPITQYRRYNRYLWTSFKSSTNVVTSGQWVRGLGLTSHVYAHGGHHFVWTNYDNDGEATHQGSYFLMELPSSFPTAPQAAFAVDFEAGIQINSHLQDVTINQNGNAQGSIIVRANAVAIDDGVRAVQLAEIVLNPTTLGHHVELGGSVFVPGGILAQYDGAHYFPALFPFAPDGLSVVPSTTVGGLGDFTAGTVNKTGTTPPDVTIAGTPPTPTVIWIEVTTGVTFAGGATSTGRFKWSINRGATYTTGEIIADNVPLGATGFTASFTAGTYATDNKYRTTSETVYRVAVVFKNTDANGRAMRSEPCFRDVTLYAGQSSINVEWIPFYALWDKPSVTVEIYRSQANVPEVLNLSFYDVNNPSMDFGSFVMNDNDSRIAVLPLLYTDGGVLPNTPVGGVSELCAHGGRLLAVPMDDPTLILASTPLVKGAVPSFTDTNYLQAKAPVAALASFVENLIVFAGSVYGMPQSDGPSSQGQGSWPELQILDPAVTTAQPLSVCVTPDGVAFLSQNPSDGYQILTRSLLVEPFGIDVNQLFPDNVVSAAIYVSAQSQLRVFTTKFGTAAGTLVYDMTHKQWSTFTGQDATSAAIAPVALGGRPVYCAWGSGAVRVESPGNYLEATTVGQPGVSYDQDILSPQIQIYVGKTGAAPNVGGWFRLRDMIGKGRSTGFLGATLNIDLYRDFSATPAVSLQTPHPNDGAWKFRGGFKCSAFQVHMRISQPSGQPPVISGFTVGICAKQGMRRTSGRNATSV